VDAAQSPEPPATDSHLRVTQGGDRAALLEGPLHYGIVITALTLLHFQQPLSVITICILCGGDASAAVIGRAFGRHRIFPASHPKVRAFA